MRIRDWSSDVCSSDLLPAEIHPWVEKNVIPYLRFVPPGVDHQLNRVEAAQHLEAYLAHDRDPLIIADWPDDLAHFCALLVTGPAATIRLDGLRMAQSGRASGRDREGQYV